MSLEQIKVPDIGGSNDVDVIEILVKPGDEVAVEDSLITLESDKASMEIPSPQAGVVESIDLKVGDKVSQGSLILKLKTASETEKTDEASQKATNSDDAAPAASATTEEPIRLPDLGTSAEVDVIEVSVQVGDEVSEEQSLITLESDKASMEIPAPKAGKITKLLVKVGDKVKTGDEIARIETEAKAQENARPERPTSEKPTAADPSQPAPQSSPKETQSSTPPPSQPVAANRAEVHAGPGVRRFARELGVDLTQISGSGRKQRILKTDVQRHVQQKLQTGNGGAGLAVAPPPKIDFSQYGPTETRPLSKINKLTGKNLHRNWVTIPHVTQFDQADITEMEAFRQSQKKAAEKQGVKLTPLVFLLKAVVAALKAYPRFNSSLDDRGENLIFKQYYHIGVAVDTTDGLVVPVVRDVDQKGLFELAADLSELSQKARDKKLSTQDMQGGCFTISSLGGIGGTAFTPIVNAPEVAILGVSKSSMQPIYQNNAFEPRLMLPLSLSYDHRVIDGADAARFCQALAHYLSDLRHLLL